MVNIDFNTLISQLLPPRKRSPRMLNWMGALVKSLNTVKTAFYGYYNTVQYNLQFNGQVINLEHVLNDAFDDTLRRIEIVDAVENPTTYLFNVIEGNELTYLFNTSEGSPLYLYNNQEYATQDDFIVEVPVGLAYTEVEMRALINKYKHSAMRYSIIEV